MAHKVGYVIGKRQENQTKYWEKQRYGYKIKSRTNQKKKLRVKIVLVLRQWGKKKCVVAHQQQQKKSYVKMNNAKKKWITSGQWA